MYNVNLALFVANADDCLNATQKDLDSVSATLHKMPDSSGMNSNVTEAQGKKLYYVLPVL